MDEIVCEFVILTIDNNCMKHETLQVSKKRTVRSGRKWVDVELGGPLHLKKRAKGWT